VSSEPTAPEPVVGVVVEALGVPVGIPVTGEAATRLRHQWSRALTERPAARSIDVSIDEVHDEAAFDYSVTTRVTLAALEATAGQRLNLHAGAVSTEDGRALALVGPSGSGKTTAIALLATRLGYLSDETVSLDEGLGVHPHPKPLSVVVDGAVPAAKGSVSPDDLGLGRPPESAYLHRLVLLHRGDDDAGLVPLPAARAIVELVEQSSSLVHLDQPVRRLADAIDACGGAWALHYREFADHLDEVVGLLDGAAQTPAPRLHHPSDRRDAVAVDGAWSRTPWTDAMEYDDELVVMVGDRVQVLGGLGVVLWLELAQPRTEGELVTAVTAAWGEHPQSGALVAEALGVLSKQGLVQPPA
jgi:energy-coupling factor transporter ATP-binding protein EcfA2